MIIKKLRYAKYYATVLYRNWTNIRESYAQHGEDILVHSLLGRIESFVDIGANDGVFLSNTYKFAKMGARGLCVEPSNKSMPKLHLNHLFHPKIRCIHGAVSSRSGHLFLKERGYESTLSKVHSKSSASSSKVRAYTLGELFRMHPRFSKIDLLSIDVEGHELDVLKGLDLIKYKPSVISIEFLDLKMKHLEFKNNNIYRIFETEFYKLLIDKNYHFVNWLHGDLIFVHNDFRD